VFRNVFHAVPDDKVRNWNDYKEFYEYYFVPTKAKAKEGESQKEEAGGTPGVTRYQWGHVVKDEFPGGVAQVKEELSKVKGTLVEMPLMFLIEEDIAQEGIGLNSLTEEIYT
jgi:phospholipase D1/2